MDVLNMLAQANFQSNNYEQAEQNFKLALDIARKSGNKIFQAEVLCDLGRLCNTVKKYQSAVTYLKEAKTLAHQNNLKAKEMDVLDNLSLTYMLTGKHKKAFDSLDASIEIAKKLGDNKGQGIILNKMGDYNKNLKEFSTAIECYERGLPKTRKFATYLNEYSLLENLGNTYLELDRYEKSLICFRHSRTLGKKHVDQYMEAKALWNLARTFQQSLDFSEALSNAELASKICSGIENDEDVKLLGEEIKEWMIKRVEGEIKGSGL